jgi:hypothetical protein
MNSSDVAPMAVAITFIVMTSLVILLRPISTKLGSVLEVLAEEKRRSLSPSPISREDTARIATVLETLDQRLAHLEERQEFTDKLLVERTGQRVER